MNNKQSKFMWISILAVSTTILILRVIDFIFEAINQDFHITRAGLDIMGTNALIIQLAIIVTSAFFFWMASDRLFNIQVFSSNKQL